MAGREGHEGQRVLGCGEKVEVWKELEVSVSKSLGQADRNEGVRIRSRER